MMRFPPKKKMKWGGNFGGWNPLGGQHLFVSKVPFHFLLGQGGKGVWGVLAEGHEGV